MNQISRPIPGKRFPHLTCTRIKPLTQCSRELFDLFRFDVHHEIYIE